MTWSVKVLKNLDNQSLILIYLARYATRGPGGIWTYEKNN